MTATYNTTDNTITEQSQIKNPGLPPDQTKYDSLQEWREDTWNWSLKHSEYTKAVALCRTIVCSPECRGLWVVGQKLEEGKDYEIKGAGDWKWCTQLKGNVFAAPVVVGESEDDLWEEVCEVFKDYVYDNGEYDFGPAVMLLKMRGYSLIKNERLLTH